MNIKHNSLIIILPIYEDLLACSALFKELKKLSSPIFIVAVDDGSINQPLDIAKIETAGLSGMIIKLRRNVGHQRAIAIGLREIFKLTNESHSIIVMDSDGEDMPSSIPALLSGLKNENIDVVVAERGQRQENIFFKIFYQVYKFLFKTLTGYKINFGNFMAIKFSALERLVIMDELSTHLAGTVLYSKLRLMHCRINRGRRYAGESKMKPTSLFGHGLKAIAIFSESVLTRVGVACAAVALFSVFTAIIVFLMKIIGYALYGWTSIFIGLLFLIFIQTGTLSITVILLNRFIRNDLNEIALNESKLIDSITRTSENKIAVNTV